MTSICVNLRVSADKHLWRYFWQIDTLVYELYDLTEEGLSKKACRQNNMKHEDIGTYYESILDKESRKEGGIYYTPEFIVDYIVKNTVGKFLESRTPKDATKIKVVDPACGAGVFLLGAYQYLLDRHEKYFGKLTMTQRRKILRLPPKYFVPTQMMVWRGRAVTP